MTASTGINRRCFAKNLFSCFKYEVTEGLECNKLAISKKLIEGI